MKFARENQPHHCYITNHNEQQYPHTTVYDVQYTNIQWCSQAPAHPGTCPTTFTCALAFACHSLKLAPRENESALNRKRPGSSYHNTCTLSTLES